MALLRREGAGLVVLLTSGALAFPIHAQRSAPQPAVKGIWEPISYSEDLDLHAAALEGARKNVAADGGDGDGAAAHRAGIVDQQRHHGVAEVGVALDLERKRLQRVDHHAREPRRVEQAFLQIEIPAAVLLPGERTPCEPRPRGLDHRGDVLP